MQQQGSCGAGFGHYLHTRLSSPRCACPIRPEPLGRERAALLGRRPIGPPTVSKD